MTEEQALKILKQPDRIGCHLIKATDEESCKFNQESIEALNIAIKALEQQPCEDCENNDGECCRLLFEKSFNKDCVSRTRKSGLHWIERFDNESMWLECPHCHMDSISAYNYCPNCGAEMERCENE